LPHLLRRILPSPCELGTGILAAAGQLLAGALPSTRELAAGIAPQPGDLVEELGSSLTTETCGSCASGPSRHRERPLDRLAERLGYTPLGSLAGLRRHE